MAEAEHRSRQGQSNHGGQAGSGAKRRLIWVLIALAAIAAAWGAGRIQGWLRTQEVQAELDALQPKIQRMHRLEARRRLTMALSALDQRNFGIAQEYIAAAARLLHKSKPEPKSKLDKLTNDIGDTSLVAADDFSDQHKLIESYIDRLDKQVPLVKTQGDPQPPPKDADAGKGS